MVKSIKIQGKSIGHEQDCFIIAEAGVNHNGDLNMAKKLVDSAVDACADAIKFQTYKTENIVSPFAGKVPYQIDNSTEGESQFEMLKTLELSFTAFRELIDYCNQRDILFLSTPFDAESADFLDKSDMPLFKVPSGEITNLPFLTHIARKGKPLIISTGMAYIGEVEKAIYTVEETGNHDIVLLHCVSNYPADPSNINLYAMTTLKTAFDLPVGFSDHTMGTEIAFAAVALGACVIEKHFTLDRNLRGPDHRASLEPGELKVMIQGIRNIQSALGKSRKKPAVSELETAAAVRKSLVAARDIPAGTLISADEISIKRPGTGLPPDMMPFILGRRAKKDIPSGKFLTLDVLI
jgi:N-acetylneuraminate synthase/N,N'-diacetyllegionaminate synthase